MNLEQLGYLIEIVRCGTMTAAAERLHLSQPNISTAIRALEKEVGCALFVRSRNGTVPTEAGERAYEIAVQIAGKLDELRTLSGKLPSDTQCELRIATVPSLNNDILAHCIMEFADRYPHVRVYNTEAGSARVLEAVLSGEVDFGFITTLPDLALPSELLLEPICEGHSCVCMGKKLAKRFQSPIKPSELAGLPFFSYSSPEFSMHSKLFKEFSVDGKAPEVIFSTSNDSAIRRMLIADQGVAIRPVYALLADAAVADGHIVAFRLASSQFASTLCAVRKKGTPYPAAAKEFTQTLRDIINPLVTEFEQRYFGASSQDI